MIFQTVRWGLQVSGVWTFECGAGLLDGDQNSRRVTVTAPKSAPNLMDNSVLGIVYQS